MVWDSEFQVGDLILDGRYRIEALLAAGRYTEVSRVRHLELRVDRVLKVVNLKQWRQGDVVRDELRARFEIEAQLGARVDDLHVLRVYEFEEVGDHLFLVEEYAAGGSLADRLAGGPLSIAEAVRITQDVANGLQALHVQRVVHGNVTPASILLDTQGHAKIANLGWSQSPWGPVEYSAAGMVSDEAAAPYKSPEQLEQVAYLTASTDVYSLGCVLFEMLTGRKWEQARRERRSLRDLRPEVPPELEATLERMLREERGRRPADASDPRKRFPAMSDVLDALEDDSAPVQRLPRMPRARKSGPLLLFLVLLVGCLVLAGAGVVWIYNPLDRLVASVETPVPLLSATPVPSSAATMPTDVHTATPQPALQTLVPGTQTAVSTHTVVAATAAQATSTARPLSSAETVLSATVSLSTPRGTTEIAAATPKPSSTNAASPDARGVASPTGARTVTQTTVQALVPTMTPTRIPSATPTNSVTPLPTWTFTVTSTPTHTATPSATPCVADAVFVADVSVPDHVELKPGTQFDKTWRVRNAGSCPWEMGYRLVFSGGDQMGASDSKVITDTAPGGTVDITVSMTVPEEPGTHSGEWRLVDARGKPFGHLLTIVIQVPEPTPTSTATPTLTPTPTATPTSTSTPTDTLTPTVTLTTTPTKTYTSTPTTTATMTRMPTATHTSAPTFTRTLAPLPTLPPSPTASRTAAPTDTPEPTASFTASPSATATTSPTLTSTATPSVEPTPCKDHSSYVADVTIPDDSLVKAGERFEKTWRVKNSGTCTWQSGYRLVFSGGERMGAAESQPLPHVIAGAEAEVTVPMIAPEVEGGYRGEWQMENAAGERFGQKLTVVLRVSSPGPPPISTANAGQLRLSRLLEIGSGGVSTVLFSPEGDALFFGTADGSVQMIGVAEGSSTRTFAGATSAINQVALAPDGTLLAAGAGNGVVLLWRVADGQLLRTLEGHTLAVRSVAFSPDGELLASAANDGTARLWRVSAGTLLHTLADFVPNELVTQLAFSPDGQLLATVSTYPRLRLWQVSDGTLARTISSTSSAFATAFSPVGTVVVTGSVDGKIRLWQVTGGTLLRTLEADTASEVRAVAFSPDAGMLAAGAADGTVRVWDIVAGSQLAGLRGQGAAVTSVAFSPAGRMLASAYSDGSIRLWAVQ